MYPALDPARLSNLIQQFDSTDCIAIVVSAYEIVSLSTQRQAKFDALSLGTSDIELEISKSRVDTEQRTIYFR